MELHSYTTKAREGLTLVAVDKKKVASPKKGEGTKNSKKAQRKGYNYILSSTKPKLCQDKGYIVDICCEKY